MAKLLEKWLSEVPFCQRDSLSIISTSLNCAHCYNSKLCCLTFLPLQHQLPKTYKEKEAFRQFLRDGMHRNFTAAFALIDFEVKIKCVYWFFFTLCCFRRSERWEWCSRRWRKLWRSHSACQHRSEPHQGASFQIVLIFNHEYRTGYYSLNLKTIVFLFLQIPNAVKDLFNSDQCNNITSKVLLFLYIHWFYFIFLFFLEQMIIVLDLSIDLCILELTVLGDAASCEGVCSQRRQWKPSCAGNYPRLDGWLSEVHKSSKCVRSCWMFWVQRYTYWLLLIIYPLLFITIIQLFIIYKYQIRIQTFITPSIDFVKVWLGFGERFFFQLFCCALLQLQRKGHSGCSSCFKTRWIFTADCRKSESLFIFCLSPDSFFLYFTWV